MFAKVSAIVLVSFYTSQTFAMDAEFSLNDRSSFSKSEVLLEDIVSKMRRLHDVAIHVVLKQRRPPEELEQALETIFTLHFNDEDLARGLILSLNQQHVNYLRQIFADEAAVREEKWKDLDANFSEMKSKSEQEKQSLLQLSCSLNSKPIKGEAGIKEREALIARLQETISLESKRQADHVARLAEVQKARDEFGDISHIVEIFDKILIVKATVDSLEEADTK